MPSSTEPAAELVLEDALDGHAHRVRPGRLVVAGFTGRDTAAVESHLRELAGIGVPVPDSTPIFMELPVDLLTVGGDIAVSGTFTSGEVEPVLVRSREGWLLGVGSDHTDRALERESIDKSKRACHKVIGARCLRLDAVADPDALELRSWLDAEGEPYQEGAARELLPLDDILAGIERAGAAVTPGDVVFCGTIPVRDGVLRPSARFTGTLRDPNLERTLEVRYRVRVSAAEGTGAAHGQA